MPADNSKSIYNLNFRLGIFAFPQAVEEKGDKVIIKYYHFGLNIQSILCTWSKLLWLFNPNHKIVPLLWIERWWWCLHLSSVPCRNVSSEIIRVPVSHILMCFFLYLPAMNNQTNSNVDLLCGSEKKPLCSQILMQGYCCSKKQMIVYIMAWLVNFCFGFICHNWQRTKKKTH